MAGDYDVLSVAERGNALRNIRDEIDLCIRANAAITKHYSRVMSNKEVVDWLTLWDDLENKIGAARLHASYASTQLTALLTSDTIYPYFSIQYEWKVGFGGLVNVNFADAGANGTIRFDNIVGSASVVPTSEVTTPDLLLVEGTADNDGIHTVASATTTTITVGDTCTAEDSTTARIRVIRRTV